MKNPLITIFLVLFSLFINITHAESCRVYFGTVAKQEQAGIYMATLDTETGHLSPAVQVSTIHCNGFIHLHPDQPVLYSTGANMKLEGIQTGSVNAFRITEPDGMLELINSQPSGGRHACQLSIDPLSKNLLVANYLGGSCAALPIHANGSLAPPTSIQKHIGSGPHSRRQTAAFTHSVNCDASGQFAIVTDLGSDQIISYHFDAEKGEFTPIDSPSFKTKPGGGPRHFTFHPSGKFAYADLELTSEAIGFEYESNTGTLRKTQTISTLPKGYSEPNTASEILTSPNGRFLYVANRGHNSIAIFAMDEKTGTLTAIGHESTRGKTPHNFSIDPSGTFLIAANAKSDSAVVFRIGEDGLLEFTGSEITLPAPSCVRFLPQP